MDYNHIRECDADMLYEYWRAYDELPVEFDYLCGLSDEELEEAGL